MKKAAIVIDNWKLEVFAKHLGLDGFEYSTSPGFTPDCLVLSVECESQEALQPTVQRAYNECAGVVLH